MSKSNILFVSTLLAAAAALPTLASAASEPRACEDMLTELRAAVKQAKPGADLAQVAVLERQGLDRCKADDDAEADAFFAAALKLLGA